MIRIFRLALLLCVGVITAQASEVFEEVPSTHVPHILTTATLVGATVGENVSFPCEVDDIGDFVIVWKRVLLEKNEMKDMILYASELKIVRNSRLNIDKGTLLISNVQPSDSGAYVCQLSTMPPTEVSHTLDVHYPPSIKTQPDDGLINVKEGETVTLSCVATGNPKPTITWKHAGRVYESPDDNSHVIISAQKDDSGEYECVADNSIGDSATTTITVEVVSAPKISPDPKDGVIVVKEGEKITMACEASGDPAPSITWRKAGEKPMKVRDENKILISQANRSHAGTYECIANNSLGISTSANFRVQVLYPPEVKAEHKWVHAGEGTDVSIACVVHGEPMPSVQWKKKDGHTIHSSDRYHMRISGHTYTLEVRHLKDEDFGGYECIASNSLSTAFEHLHIIGTPQVPMFTSKPHGAQGTKYTISWVVDSQTPVDEYSLMFRKKSSDEEWQSKTVTTTGKQNGHSHVQMYQLVDLEPSTSYEALVSARNKFGWSKQSEALIFTTKKEEKHSEMISGSSAVHLWSSITLLPVVFISVYRNMI